MNPTQNLDDLSLTDRQRQALDLLYRFDSCRKSAADALGINERNIRKLLASAVDAGWDVDDCPPLIKPKPKLQMVELDELILNDRLQPRESLNQSTVAEYAEIYRDHGPEGMEPIRAYRDRADMLLVTRGFTRIAGAQRAKLTKLPCEVFPNALYEDLLLDSLGGNKHGLQLTNADKNRAIKLYHETIDEANWLPTREVAKLIGCSHEMVAKYRRPESDEQPKTQEKTQPSTADKSETDAPQGHGDADASTQTDDEQDKAPPNVAETIIDRLTTLGDLQGLDKKTDAMAPIPWLCEHSYFDEATILQVASNDPRLIVTANEEGETMIAIKEVADESEEEKPTQFHKQSASSKESPASARAQYIRNLLAEKIRKKAVSQPQFLPINTLLLCVMYIGYEAAEKDFLKTHHIDLSYMQTRFKTSFCKQLADALENKSISTASFPPLEEICALTGEEYPEIESLAKTEFPY